MKRVCDWYVKHSALIGLFYCALPAIAWFVLGLFIMTFREVYVLRLGISLVLGGTLAAFANRYGVKLWLVKHRSPEGPATILDGLVIGCSVGMGIALIPPLTMLIKTNHLEQVKAYIIMAYLITMGAGAIIGAILAAIGRKYVDVSATTQEGQQ